MRVTGEGCLQCHYRELLHVWIMECLASFSCDAFVFTHSVCQPAMCVSLLCVSACCVCQPAVCVSLLCVSACYVCQPAMCVSLLCI